MAMDVHLRNLRYFVAVGEELHFTRAAERLHLSQPALSKQIRQLERELGFSLFRRDHRTVVLTHGGETLLGAARDLLGAWDQALGEAARDAGSRLRVGFQTSVAGGLYTDALSVFGAAHPEVNVGLRLHAWSDPSAGLVDDSSDVAFLWLPVPDRERLVWRTLRTEPRHVAMRRGHPLAMRSELHMTDLLDEPFIALPPSAGVLREYWLALDSRGGHPVRIGAHADSPDATFEAVAAGHGVVLLAAGNAELYARPEIVSRPVADIAPAELAIAWRAGDTRRVIHDFVECAQRAASPVVHRPATHAAPRVGHDVDMLTAVRAAVPGGPTGLADVARHARELALLGWVRAEPAGGLLLHAEGDPAAIEGLLRELDVVDSEPASVEGHEQFAIRGVPSGQFVVQEHQATAHHFDLRLEVCGVMRSWAVPKGPSMDAAVKRLAVEVEDHALSHNDYEGPGVIVWDRGTYEQRGRVPWPAALERGHAVFELEGEKLRGGFALQRTRGGAKPQWLLIKRRDEYARPGSDIAAEHPESVLSGRTLGKTLA
jgi:DNA ligase D-like protein (predicted 3'-phosphoesterase)